MLLKSYNKVCPTSDTFGPAGVVADPGHGKHQVALPATA